MCSGVYYSKSNPGSSPITFSDPRGTNRLRLLLGQGGKLPDEERQFEPAAPFHHQVSELALRILSCALLLIPCPRWPLPSSQYSFLPTEGDMVLFPSYTAHEVPSNPFETEDASRIVW